MDDREYEALLQREMKRQYRDLIWAKESGQCHHIDANGEVVIVKEHKIEPKTV
jgi:hypothetical protein